MHEQLHQKWAHTLGFTKAGLRYSSQPWHQRSCFSARPLLPASCSCAGPSRTVNPEISC